MTNQPLDKPEEKRIFGLDLHINKFHIINPDTDQLLISEEKKFDLTVFLAAILFTGMGLFFFYLAYNSYFNYKEGFGGMILPLLLGIVPFLLGIFSIRAIFVTKGFWHFYPTDLVMVNSFGRKKIIPKSEVLSIYITKHITTEYGQPKSISHSIDLKVNYGISKEGSIQLFYLHEKNSVASFLGEINTKRLAESHSDAHRLGSLISDHWGIPFKS